MIFVAFQVLAGILAASFIEWTVHKHVLHELGKKKVSIFFLSTGVFIMPQPEGMVLLILLSLPVKHLEF